MPKGINCNENAGKIMPVNPNLNEAGVEKLGAVGDPLQEQEQVS